MFLITDKYESINILLQLYQQTSSMHSNYCTIIYK